jgi:hypothetical protein
MGYKFSGAGPSSSQAGLECGSLVLGRATYRKYAQIQRDYPGRVIISTLDPYYRSITFVKEGTYDLPGGGTVKLAGRRASKVGAEGQVPRAA